MISAPESETEKDQTRQPPPRRKPPPLIRIFRAFKRYKNRQDGRRQVGETPHQANERRIADWTARVGWFTFALVVISLITAGIFQRQLSVMRGQLDAMERDQRPYLMLTDPINQPFFLAVDGDLGKAGLGELIWNWNFTNFGKGRALGVQIDEFMKIEEGPFKRTRGAAGPGFAGDMPPTKINFGTISSGPILKNYVDILLQKDLAIVFLIEFRYSDLIGNSYETDICVSRFRSGGMPFLDPAKCKKDKEK
jgi:hypothetical protein